MFRLKECSPYLARKMHADAERPTLLIYQGFSRFLMQSLCPYFFQILLIFSIIIAVRNCSEQVTTLILHLLFQTN